MLEVNHGFLFRNYGKWDVPATPPRFLPTALYRHHPRIQPLSSKPLSDAQFAHGLASELPLKLLIIRINVAKGFLPD